jgi:glycosyltransferase involved in cell wall biosynthesis
MKIAVISRSLPGDLELKAAGIYKRLDMFIQGLKLIGELDMLFYVDENIPCTRAYILNLENRLSILWNVNVKLSLCRLLPNRLTNNFSKYYFGPVFSIYNHANFYRIAGEKQVAACRQLISRDPDIVFVHRLNAMCVVRLSKMKTSPIYLDLDDIEHIAFMRGIRQPPWWRSKFLLYLQVPSLLLGELRSIRLTQKTFVCSEHDRKYLNRIWHLKNVATIPNAVEIRQEYEQPTTMKLLFIGTYRYYPNVVGADYLIREIWPMILAALPNAKLIIAGENPENIPSFETKPIGVEFRGFVDNLDELYKEVSVVCCPILSGSGTRIKILEAAAYGKPVVSTKRGAEGLELREGQDILLQNDPNSFAAVCIKLLKNKLLANNIGKSAKGVVSRLYDKMNVVQSIKNQFVY